MAEFINRDDSLNEGREKINKSIQDATDAKNTANDADQKADQALSNSESTQEQLDQVVIEGDSSVEAAQARVDTDGNSHQTLKERLDTEHSEVTSQLAETTLDYISLGKQNEGGEVDVHNDLVALVNLVKSEKKGLYIPNGRFYVSDDLEIDMIRNIKIDGNIIMAEGKTLTLSYDSRRSLSCNWYVNSVQGKVRLMGLKNGDVNIQYAEELELYALSGPTGTVTGSIAYSRFKLGTINTFRITGEQADGSGIPWINENEFHGGRITNFYMDGTYSHNNNTFYKPMLEDSKIHIEVGGSNMFYDVRFEGENDISFGEKAYDNIFIRSWQSFKGSGLRRSRESAYPVTDYGAGNMVINSLDIYYENKEIFEINCKSNNFDVGAFIKKKNSLNFATNYNRFFESGLIEVDHDIGVNATSDIDMFRVEVQFYDVNKELITSDPSEYLSYLDMTWSTDTNSLRSLATTNELVLAIFKNSPIKYFTIRFTQYPINDDFQYFRFSIKSPKRSVISVPILEKYKTYHSETKPSVGYWEVGDTVKNNTPTQGGYIGWVCTQEGEFDTENEPIFEGYGLIG